MAHHIKLPQTIRNQANGSMDELDNDNGVKLSNGVVAEDGEATSDSESEIADQDHPKSRQISERKRLQYAVFNDW